MSTLDDYDWGELIDALKPLPDIQEALVKLSHGQDTGNASYNAFTLAIPRSTDFNNDGTGSPYTRIVLGFDLTRIRAMIVSSEAGVYIGRRSDLQASTISLPQGFLLPVNSPGLEYKSVDELYVKFVGTSATTNTQAFVSVIAETNGKAY